MYGGERSNATAAAARQAAGLFALCGVLALLFVPVDFSRAIALTVAGVSDIAIAAVIVDLPWSRWRLSSTLWIVGPALGAIATAQWADLLPVRSYGVFFVLVFAWIGGHHPRRTAIKMAPVLACGYVGPLLVSDADPPIDPRAVVVVIVVGVLVAETMARAAEASARARARSARSAQTFATIARATCTFVESETESVLDTVVDTVMALGYEGVNIAVVEPDTLTFSPQHSRGLMASVDGTRFPVSAGLTGQVAATREPIVVDDYQRYEHAVEKLRVTGARTIIGVPVIANDVLVAVLLAARDRVQQVETEDIEALRVVAAHASAALHVATSLSEERRRAETHQQASITDGLTGIGNRRRGQELLTELGFGDAVAIIDVDHFKHVNDTYGHAAGDSLLTGLAEYLATHIRTRDHVVRWGGEEFLVILPDTSLDGARKLVDRLRADWASTSPLTTFSAGTAARRSNEDASTTVERADTALYYAKTNGRNRVNS